MQIANEPRFSCFVFEPLNERDQPINIVICRGTFEIDGKRITPSAQQAPVVLADEYHDLPLTSACGWCFLSSF